jgi:outer membrane protein TolC
MPSLAFDGYAGSEQRYMPSAANTFYGVNEEKLKFNQLIYDFGKTGAVIDTAKDTYYKSMASYNGTMQDVTLEGINAYLNVYKAYQTLAFSARYQKNVQKQVSMEKKRVSKGSGYSTDVLEAEAQLSGAQARLSRARGGLTTAKNSFDRTFREDPTAIKHFRLPRSPRSLLPKTVGKAVQTALRNNTQIRSLQYDEAIARQAIHTARSSFAPSINAVVESKRDWNVGGTLGRKFELVEKAELSYPIFSGFGDMAALHAAKNSLLAAVENLDNQRLITEQKTRDDWQQVRTSRENFMSLQKQTDQLAKFLHLATKERQLGRKTLLEVLVADTNYINAADASIAAKVQLFSSLFTVLRDMNELSLAKFGVHTVAHNHTMKIHKRAAK